MCRPYENSISDSVFLWFDWQKKKKSDWKWKWDLSNANWFNVPSFLSFYWLSSLSLTHRVTITLFPFAELLHKVVEERQVKSSTPRKLSVSSERMEQSFKKVQRYAVTKCSLSLPMKGTWKSHNYTQCQFEFAQMFSLFGHVVISKTGVS